MELRNQLADPEVAESWIHLSAKPDLDEVPERIISSANWLLGVAEGSRLDCGGQAKARVEQQHHQAALLKPTAWSCCCEAVLRRLGVKGRGQKTLSNKLRRDEDVFMSALVI